MSNKSLQDLINEDNAQVEEPTVQVEDTQPEVTDDVGKEAPVASPLRSFLSANQFSVPEDIDEDTLSRQMAERLRQAARHEQENAELRARLEEQAKSQQAPPPAAPAPVQPEPVAEEPVAVEAPIDDIWTESYDLNPADIALATQGSDGTFEPRDSSPDARRAADALNKAIAVGNARIRRLASNPQSFIQYIENKFEQKYKQQSLNPDDIVAQVTEKLREEREALERETTIDNWYKTNGPLLFEADENGQFRTDMNTGSLVKTETGRKFQAAMETLMQYGASEYEAIQKAWDFVSPSQPAAAPQQPQPQFQPTAQAPVVNGSPQPVVHNAPTAADRQENQRRFLDREVPLPEPQRINNLGTGRPEPRNAVPSLMDIIAREQQANGV